MKTIFCLLISILFLVSCVKTKKQQSVIIPAKKTTQTVTQKIDQDSIIFTRDSCIINKIKFVISWNEESAYIVNQKKDTIYVVNDSGLNFPAFLDYNEDGYKDVIFHFHANNPTYELALFDPRANTFRLVENYTAYSGAIKIKGTNYFYSYHRSGCADSNWDSDLLIIKNYKAIRIGNIHGAGCEGEKKNGIFIYKINDNDEILIKSIPRKPGYYADKIDFIEEYWNKNYNLFE